eukprot:scaffold88036_cov61-Phaeocystis_antarctica.AAC.4
MEQFSAKLSAGLLFLLRFLARSEKAKKLRAERAKMLSRYLLFDRVAGYAFFTELHLRSCNSTKKATPAIIVVLSLVSSHE